MNKDQLLPFLVKTGIVTLVILLGVVIYSQFGSGLPFSVVNTTKSDFFTATGEGKVYAKPDVAIVQIGYTTSAKTVSEAQNQANETVNKITEEIKKLGIAENDIQTTYYNISPEYNPNQPIPLPAIAPGSERVVVDSVVPANPNQITGYNVSTNMQIKVKDFQKINQVIDTATANGANQIGGLSFTIDDTSKYVEEARKMAIDDAKANANSLASQTGIRLGRIVNVYESNMGPRGGVMYNAVATKEMSVDQAPTQVQPGQTEISLQVTLNYETR